MGICGSFCNSFNFVNIGFVVQVIYSQLNFTGIFASMESLFKNFVISFFTDQE